MHEASVLYLSGLHMCLLNTAHRQNEVMRSPPTWGLRGVKSHNRRSHQQKESKLPFIIIKQS